ncbi:MAG TPA: polyprenol monophosphomannose synthase [Acidimicrobiales bacterium]|nr:polyprenol monophosphomannose synthase [Acidimicrobiales bacterium]
MRILVVLPTYNESTNIEAMLRAVRANLPAANILVVDDSSPDGTADIAKQLSGELGSLDVIVRPEKNGLGPAYLEGFHWGIDRGYEAFVEMDSDFSHDPASLPSLIQPITEGADLVIGSRYVPGGSIPDWKFSRRLLSRFGNLYAKWMLDLGVEDSTAGFRVYSERILKKIDLDAVTASGYGFQIEMTFRAKQAGAAIHEVPIRFVDRVNGESKMSSSVVTEALALVTKWGIRRLFFDRRPH